MGMTAEGQKKRIRWTVANVRKPPISAGKLAESGHEVIIGRSPRIVHPRSSKVTKLRKEGDVYTLDLWIHLGKARTQGGNKDGQGFTRPK